MANIYSMVDIVQQQIQMNPQGNYNKSIRKHELIKNICDYYKITLFDLRSRNSKATFRDARNLAMYCLHKVLLMTSTEVGVFINRNHATVLSGSRRTANWIETDKKYEQLVMQIINK